MVNGRYGIAGVSNYARGVFGSSNISGVSNQMDYITIATTGNATDFGDLTVARGQGGCVSNSTRGGYMGGYGAAEDLPGGAISGQGPLKGKLDEQISSYVNFFFLISSLLEPLFNSI